MEWISVKDKFPEDRKSVLGFIITIDENIEWSGIIQVYFERETGWHRCELYDPKKVFVTHWMPLPEKPKD